jgi:hypothetical protein
MELTGLIIAVMPAKSGVSARTGNPWMNQEYVIEVPGQYPKRCVFSIFGEDRIKQFAIQNGETITVQFDIDAREYQGRWFNEIRAYNVIRGQQPAQAPATQQADMFANNGQAPAPSTAPAQTPFPPADQPEGGNADDLPF